MLNTGVETAIQVAVGILTQGDKVFIARRSPSSHQGDKWEFPGGKLEPGEDTFAALQRELHEELGIDVQAAQPFMQLRHSYPDREVLLDVWRITRYRGTPHGREGQEACWVRFRDLPQIEFPEADRPIWRRLWLPPLYLITDSRRFGKAEFLTRLERALRAGARLVQLREPSMPAAEYRAYAIEVADLCHRYHGVLLLNAEPDWVQDCGADGVHLNSRRLMEYRRRPLGQEYWVAASCHHADELEHAAQLNVDFAVLSPVAKTATHPDATPLGWEKFQQLCSDVDLPVYALGGMRASDLRQARFVSAQGLAMLSEVWAAESIEAVIAALSD